MRLENRIKNDVLLRDFYKNLCDAIDEGDLEKYKKYCKLHIERERELKREHSEKMSRYYAARGWR